MHPCHGAGHPHPLLKKTHPHQIVGVEHPLKGARECLGGSPGALRIKAEALLPQGLHPFGIRLEPSQALGYQIRRVGGDLKNFALGDPGQISLPFLLAVAEALFRCRQNTDDAHRDRAVALKVRHASRLCSRNASLRNRFSTLLRAPGKIQKNDAVEEDPKVDTPQHNES